MSAEEPFELPERKFIVEKLMGTLRDGDILFRASNAKGPFGIPFCKWVQAITKSDYSHAAIVIMFNDYPCVLEVSDVGTRLYRLIDWLDFCVGGRLAVYRLRQPEEERLREEMIQFMKWDPEYDFSFSDSKTFYCTESVAYIYDACGIKLMEPVYPKGLFKGWRWFAFLAVNWCSKVFANKGFSLDVPGYFVGNSDWGMMSSPDIVQVARISND